VKDSRNYFLKIYLKTVRKYQVKLESQNYNDFKKAMG